MSEDRRIATLEQLAFSATQGASAALGLMLNDGIEVVDCRVRPASAQTALADRLRSRHDWLVVSQTAMGVEPVKVSLLVSKSQVECLLDHLLGRRPQRRDGESPVLDTTEIDALRETANIVTGACAAAFERELGITGMSLPTFASQDLFDDIVHFLIPDQNCMCAESRLKAANCRLELDLLMAIAHKGPTRSVGHTSSRAQDAPADAPPWEPRPERT